jgi:hypothetical protein
MGTKQTWRTSFKEKEATTTMKATTQKSTNHQVHALKFEGSKQ